MPKRYSARSGVQLEEPKAPTTFSDGLPVPGLLIFDIDYTLWPFWVDTHVSPPVKAGDGNTKVKDATGQSYALYRDVPTILHAAHVSSIPLALASRTYTPDLARSMLNLLHVQAPKPAPAGPDESTSEAAAESAPDGTTAPASTSLPPPKKALEFFAHQQIFPGDKRAHMKGLQRSSGVAYEDMLFFDDETRNSNVETLGVCFRLVRDGVTSHEVDEGIREWRRRRNIE